MPRAPRRRRCLGSRSPRAKSGKHAHRAGQTGRISTHRARSSTCHGRPSRPARGKQAPKGAVLRAPGLTLQRPHSPDEPTVTAPYSQGRSQNRTGRAPKQQEAEEAGRPKPLHSATAGALRWEPLRKPGTAPAP